MKGFTRKNELETGAGSLTARGAALSGESHEKDFGVLGKPHSEAATDLSPPGPAQPSGSPAVWEATRLFPTCAPAQAALTSAWGCS